MLLKRSGKSLNKEWKKKYANEGGVALRLATLTITLEESDTSLMQVL